MCVCVCMCVSVQGLDVQGRGGSRPVLVVDCLDNLIHSWVK